MRDFQGVTLSEDAIRSAIAASKKPVDTATLHPRLQAILGQPRPLQHTPEWFEQRRHLLTASNVASFLGQNKYCSRKRFLQNVKEELESPGSNDQRQRVPACVWGTQHEAEAAVLYSLVTGNRCYPEDIGLVVHPKHQMLGASPDRVLVDRPVLVEIKSPWRRKIEPEIIPSMYVAQVQAQMEVCDMDECHFVQFFPATLCAPGTISVLLVRRDPQWWKRYGEQLNKFTDALANTEMRTRKPAAKRRKVSPTSTSTTKSTPAPAVKSTPAESTSTPDTDTITVSPGVYNVYIDERIQPAKWLEQLVSGYDVVLESERCEDCLPSDLSESPLSIERVERSAERGEGDIVVQQGQGVVATEAPTESPESL